MSQEPSVSRDSVVVLLKGGRLASWNLLTPEQQRAYSQEHVDLMLSVAREHRMTRLEGFKLLSQKQSWARFWVIEFPTLEGAEAWIDAEMEPPYGRYGHFEYYLARPWGKDYFADWATGRSATATSPPVQDPRVVRPHEVDRGSVVVLLFGRAIPGADEATPEKRGDDEHIELMRSVAQEHGLMRIEAFRLMAPQPEWHRAWVIEFPTIAGAEAWMEGELRPPHGAYAVKEMHLARKWAPDYFAGWVPPRDAG